MEVDWIIYSAGDGEFLWYVLRGVAMITGDGSWMSMIMVGFFLGIIWVVAKGLLDGAREIEIHSLVGAWLLFSVLFGTTTTVQVQDGYSGGLAQSGEPITGVPLGVAAAGGFISAMGKTVTEQFEQVYTIPGAPEFMSIDTQGYGGALEAILRLRGLDGVSYMHDETGFYDSLVAYSRDCISPGLNVVNSPLDRAEIRNAGDTFSAIRFDSDVYWTEVHVNEEVSAPPGCSIVDSETAECSCADAHDMLGDFIDSYKDSDDLSRIVTATVSGRGHEAGEDDVSDSMKALLGAAVDHQDYILNRILDGALQEGEVAAAAETGDIAAQTMIETARAQRDTTWALEDSMFRQIVMPLMTFMESAMYAVTPVVALMIVIGGSGLSLLVKYLGFVIWTQLWLPVMSITNFFAQWAATNSIEEVVLKVGSHVAVESLNGINIVESELQHWLGVAGMLGAATPVITLMLVTGSAMAASRLTGQFESGSDNVAQEHAQGPIDAKAGEVTAGGQGMLRGDYGGWGEEYRQAADGRAGQLNFGQDAGTQAQHMHEQAASQQEAWRSGVSSSIAEDKGFQQTWGTMASEGDSASDKLSGADSKAWQEAERVGEQQQWNDQEKAAYAAALSISASGGASGELFGGKLGAETKAALESSSEGSFQFSDSVNEQLDKSFTEEGKLSEEHSDIKEASQRDSEENRGTASVVDSAREEWSETREAAESSRVQAQQLERMGSSWGSSQTYENAEARAMLTHNSGMAENYRDWQSERLESLGRDEEAEKVRDMSHAELGDHFVQTANEGPAEGENGVEFFSGMVGTLEGYSPEYEAGTAVADQNPTVAEDNSTRSQVESNATGPQAEQGDGQRGQEGMRSTVNPTAPENFEGYSPEEVATFNRGFLDEADLPDHVNDDGTSNLQGTGREKGEEMEAENTDGGSAQTLRDGGSFVSDAISGTVSNVGDALTGGLYSDAVDSLNPSNWGSPGDAVVQASGAINDGVEAARGAWDSFWGGDSDDGGASSASGTIDRGAAGAPQSEGHPTAEQLSDGQGGEQPATEPVTEGGAGDGQAAAAGAPQSEGHPTAEQLSDGQGGEQPATGPVTEGGAGDGVTFNEYSNGQITRQVASDGDTQTETISNGEMSVSVVRDGEGNQTTRWDPGTKHGVMSPDEQKEWRDQKAEEAKALVEEARGMSSEDTLVRSGYEDKREG